MSELEERVRQIARDIVHQEHGENIGESKVAITFSIPTQIDGRSLNAKYAWYWMRLAFDSVGVFDNREQVLVQYENHNLVIQQLRRLNNRYDNRLEREVIRRFRLRDKQHLLTSMRGPRPI